MLSEEEQKAIKILGTLEFREKTKNYNKIDLEDVGATNIVLNLITKLQKENELAKEQLKKQCEIADERNDLLVKIQELQKQIDLMAEVTFEKFKAPLIIEYGIENKKQFIKIFEQKAKEKRKEYEENNPDNKVEKI